MRFKNFDRGTGLIFCNRNRTSVDLFKLIINKVYIIDEAPTRILTDFRKSI